MKKMMVVIALYCFTSGFSYASLRAPLSKHISSDNLVNNAADILTACPEMRIICEQMATLADALKAVSARGDDCEQMSVVLTYESSVFDQLYQEYTSLLALKVRDIDFVTVSFDQCMKTVSMSVIFDRVMATFAAAESGEGEYDGLSQKVPVLNMLIDMMSGWAEQARIALAGIDKKQKINPIFAEQLLQIFSVVDMVAFAEQITTSMVTEQQGALMRRYTNADVAVQLKRNNGKEESVSINGFNELVVSLTNLQSRLNTNEVLMKKIQTTGQALWKIITDYQSQQIIC